MAKEQKIGRQKAVSDLKRELILDAARKAFEADRLGRRIVACDCRRCRLHARRALFSLRVQGSDLRRGSQRLARRSPTDRQPIDRSHQDPGRSAAGAGLACAYHPIDLDKTRSPGKARRMCSNRTPLGDPADCWQRQRSGAEAILRAYLQQEEESMFRHQWLAAALAVFFVLLSAPRSWGAGQTTVVRLPLDRGQPQHRRVWKNAAGEAFDSSQKLASPADMATTGLSRAGAGPPLPRAYPCSITHANSGRGGRHDDRHCRRGDLRRRRLPGWRCLHRQIR